MYVNERFELDADNLIKKIQPNWGWGQFSEFIYYQNYSRFDYSKNKQENWHDTVLRVINGVMSIRKDWYLRNKITWDEAYWQDYATEMAISLCRMEWTPPGRGMWSMGTNLIYERGAMALYNCFTGETKFYTDNGVTQFFDCVGSVVKVQCEDGEFRTAHVQHYGVQTVQKICFKLASGKSNYRQIETATKNHRWLTVDGETTNLRKGDKILIKSTPHKIRNLETHSKGFVHGIVYGDGSSNKYGSQVRLCGEKASYLHICEQNITHIRTNYPQSYNGDPIVFFSKDYKRLPVSTDLDYLCGFFEGWLAVDSWQRDDLNYCLDTTSVEGKNWVFDHAGLFGYIVVGISKDTKATNFGERTSPLNRIKLKKADVLFIVDWIVEQHEKRDVFCLSEPETKSFRLRNGLPTGNCAYTEVGQNYVSDIAWLMNTLMYGVGVGFGPLRTGLKLYDPPSTYEWTIPDSREGWVESVVRLLRAFRDESGLPEFDYSEIRPSGTPIKTFGGIASGPESLEKLHETLTELSYRYVVGELDEIQYKCDIANLVGVCVITGNVRRSAEIACGDLDDSVFSKLKDYDKYPEREAWGWMSNNTVKLEKDSDFEQLGIIACRNIDKHDIGYMNMRNIKHGRIGKFNDNVREDAAVGLNPCGEIPLEHREVCNLSETAPTRCTTENVWLKACEYATFYSSTVCLLPTHQPSTNKIVNRNRRIGVSIVDFTGWKHEQGTSTIIRSLRKGYNRVRETNRELAAEAGIPESIRVTTVKPGGTIPKLLGRTSGASYPTFRHTLIRVNVRKDTEMSRILKEANVPFEESVYTPETTEVFEFPIEQGPAPPATEVSVWEQAMNVVLLQREWADNAVSNTLYFKPGVEDAELEAVLASIAPYTKSISLLPHSDKGAFRQMPQEGISRQEYQFRVNNIEKIDWSTYVGDGQDEKYCTGDVCENPNVA